MAAYGAAAPPAPVDERTLVDRARAADAEAFAMLYRLHLDRIHRFCWRRSGSRHVAEDVTAATFERALRQLHRFRWQGEGSFASWLYRIAANELAEHHRQERRHRTPRARAVAERLHPDRTPAPGDDELVAGLDRAGDAGQLRAALSSLNPRYEQALTLRYLAGLDHAEAAAAMGVSKPTMAVLVHRASAALRKALASEEPR